MEHIIYKLTSPSGKIYIGRTENFEDRMKQHKYESKKQRRDCSLYRAIIKYGWENFTKEIIAKCSESEIELLEEIFIKKYNSVKNGYNDTYVTSGGGNHWKHKSKEEKDLFCKRMSEITLGENNPMYGKKHSDEAKQKQKEKAKGRFSLPWFINKYGPEEGSKLYVERCERLSNRRKKRGKDGKFI